MYCNITKAQNCYCGAANCRGKIEKVVELEQSKHDASDASTDNDDRIDKKIDDLLTSGIKNISQIFKLGRLMNK